MKKYLFIFLVFISSFFFFDKVYAIDYLSSLNASGTDLSLEKGVFDYDVVYSGTSGSTKIYAALNSDNYSFVKGYGPRTVNLDFGINKVLVKLLNDNNDLITYTINITRKDERIDNNYLNNIVVNGKALKFDSEKQVYSFSVGYGVNKLDIRTSTSDSKARYNIVGANNLMVGDNTVTIEVFAENGKRRDYILKVYRSSSNSIPMSSNTHLALLKIANYDINFDSDNYDYKIIVKDEAPLKIKALAEDEEATVKIVGNRSIKHNGIVEVRVIAEDGSQDIYSIKVVVEGMSNIDILTIVIIVASLVALISMTVVIISMLKKRKENNNKLNIEVVRKDIPKMNVDNEEDRKLMAFLLNNENINTNTDINNINTSNMINTNDAGNSNGNIMICRHCGSINNSAMTNCSNCGNKLGDNF